MKRQAPNLGDCGERLLAAMMQQGSQHDCEELLSAATKRLGLMHSIQEGTRQYTGMLLQHKRKNYTETGTHNFIVRMRGENWGK